MFKVYLKSLIYFSLLLASCSTGIKGEQYHQWINNPEKGIIKEVSNVFFNISVQFRPVEYLIAIENKRNELSIEELEQKKESKSELQYYNIKISSKTGEDVLRTNLSDEQEYFLRTSYYLSEFENDLLLIEGKDTLSPVLYHFERTYGALPFNNISVAFKNASTNTNKEFLLLDRALGFGLQKFFFLQEDINNIPRLKSK